MYKENVKQYFCEKAESYDAVDDQTYWRLSDAILKEKLIESIIDSGFNKDSSFKFLDAGGGTGRWSKVILDTFPNAKGEIWDLSKEMLSVAAEKLNLNGYKDRFETSIRDLDEYNYSENEKFDLVICFHNVLGFVSNPFETIKNFDKILSDNGQMYLLLPNYYHLLMFNIKNKNFDLVEEAVDSLKGRFTPEMPSMNLFKAEEVTQFFSSLDGKMSQTGFPIYIYPGYEETQLFGENQAVLDVLSSKEHYDEIFNLELKSFGIESNANRGNQIFVKYLK